jgi:hypothetical protein
MSLALLGGHHTGLNSGSSLNHFWFRVGAPSGDTTSLCFARLSVYMMLGGVQGMERLLSNRLTCALRRYLRLVLGRGIKPKMQPHWNPRDVGVSGTF